MCAWRCVTLAFLLVVLSACAESDTLTIRPWKGTQYGVLVTEQDLTDCLGSTPFDTETYTRAFYEDLRLWGPMGFQTLAESTFRGYSGDIWKCLVRSFEAKRYRE